jgi:hypothetical protein
MFPRSNFRSPVIIAGLFLSLGSGLAAQNLSNVFSPDVDAGEQEFEWRVAWDPDTDSIASRAHIQYGLNESWRLRLIASGRDRPGDRLNHRYLRFEAQWQILEDQDAGWDSALRFEAQGADGDDTPHRLRVAWSNKWALGENWQLRLIGLAARQVGPDRASGILLESRARVATDLTNRLGLAIDLFSDYGSTADLADFDEQEHQIGPLLQIDLGGGFDVSLGALFGLTDASSDVELRSHFIWAF